MRESKNNDKRCPLRWKVAKRPFLWPKDLLYNSILVLLGCLSGDPRFFPSRRPFLWIIPTVRRLLSQTHFGRAILIQFLILNRRLARIRRQFRSSRDCFLNLSYSFTRSYLPSTVTRSTLNGSGWQIKCRITTENGETIRVCICSEGFY